MFSHYFYWLLFDCNVISICMFMLYYTYESNNLSILNIQLLLLKQLIIYNTICYVLFNLFTVLLKLDLFIFILFIYYKLYCQALFCITSWISPCFQKKHSAVYICTQNINHLLLINLYQPFCYGSYLRDNIILLEDMSIILSIFHNEFLTNKREIIRESFLSCQQQKNYFRKPDYH